MQYDQFIDCVMCLQNLFQNRQINQSEIEMKWNECQLLSCTLEKDFNNFVRKGIEHNIEFAFWNKFLTELYPNLRDLTRSHRVGGWLLHLSALERALPLFFCYNRTIYARWGSLYYEDCLKLPTKFPEIYEEFQRGSFVVNFKKTCASAVLVDQALEKA